MQNPELLRRPVPSALFLFAFVVACLTGLQAHAQEVVGEAKPSVQDKTESKIESISPTWLDLRGNLSLGAWSGDRWLNDQTSFGVAQLQLNIATKFDSAWSFHSNANVSYLGSKDDSADSAKSTSIPKRHSYLRDAYLKWDIERAEWRIGTQVFSWGRADRINPTDNLSARDFTSPFVTDEEQKSGSVASSLSLDLNADTRLQFVVQRVPDGSKQGQVPSARIEAGFPLAFTSRTYDYALRLDQSVSSIDWSVSYFDGVEKVRSLELLQQRGRLLGVQRRYAALQSVGADAATTSGNWGLRGELAYLRFKPENAENAGRLSHWYGVFGVENNLAHFSHIVSNATFGVQYFFRRFAQDPHFANLPDAWRTPLDKLQLANNQLHHWQDGFTVRFAQRLMNDQLDYEIVGMHNFRDGDFVLRPRLNFRYSDSTKWVFGCDLFRGKDHSFFGSLKKNSLAFTELVLIF
ncbi:hypothetical protein [Undibacterium flavidum]|uniref:Alginate export domain-containing protein n=1 Tax=Undibacterium flavidum TaxID=2762297 RepID=A0ABR6Y9V8_9BURK|nr:hypothetical protein [Undibacterium flavidum]MBC3873432.1 hypothetical protein [Undibacterium flavidum]